MLHRVLPDPRSCYDPEMAVSLAAFEGFLGWVAEAYEVVPLVDLQRHLRLNPGRGTRPACALTFDDGWADTFAHAFPLLQRQRLPATVFLPLHFIGTGRRFWQERLYYHLQSLRGQDNAAARLRAVGAVIPWCPELHASDLAFAQMRRQLMRRSSPEAELFVERLGAVAGVSLALTGRAFLNWDEARSMLAAGITFGSHTLNHTLLSGAAPAAAEAELRLSREALSEHLGVEVTTFAYPSGGLSPFAREQVRAAGYACAVTTAPGLTRAGSDPWRLPRIALSDPQLGWKAQGTPAAGGVARHFSSARGRPARPAFNPATLQMHMARARALPPRPRPAVLTGAGTDAGGRLRIGVIVDNPDAWKDAPQAHLGGSELQLRRMLAALDPDFYAPELYFLQRPPDGLPRHLPWPGFAAAPARSGPGATLRGLYRLLRQRRPAVVQTLFVDGTFLGVPAAWLARVPVILCTRRNAGHWKKWHHRCALRLVNRMADAWQVNSSSVAEALQSQEGIRGAAIEILPNSIDLERFVPASPAARVAARQQLGLPEQAFVTVSVANYRPVKRLDTLVAAAATVCGSLPAAQFILLGEGPEREPLAAAIAAAGLEACVHLAGASEHIITYLTASDVGVLTSGSEGCSNAVLEYMAAGLPMVLSDIAANRGLLPGAAGDGLFAVGNAAAAAAAILECAADPGERAASGRAHRHLAEQYGGGAFVERVQAHYLRVAGTARRGWPFDRRHT